jgi:hypothetical protein
LVTVILCNDDRYSTARIGAGSLEPTVPVRSLRLAVPRFIPSRSGRAARGRSVADAASHRRRGIPAVSQSVDPPTDLFDNAKVIVNRRRERR